VPLDTKRACVSMHACCYAAIRQDKSLVEVVIVLTGCITNILIYKKRKAHFMVVCKV